MSTRWPWDSNWDWPPSRRAYLRISTKFLGSPTDWNLTPGEFRKLFHGLAGFASSGSDAALTDRVFRAYAQCSQAKIDKYVALGLLLRTEEGRLVPGAPFEVVRPGQRVRPGGEGGWTYLIQRGLDGPVKIGSTYTDPLQRLANLQTAHDVRLHLVGFTEGASVERELHEQFADRRLQGEWFDRSVLEEITFYGRVWTDEED